MYCDCSEYELQPIRPTTEWVIIPNDRWGIISRKSLEFEANKIIYISIHNKSTGTIGWTLHGPRLQLRLNEKAKTANHYYYHTQESNLYTLELCCALVRPAQCSAVGIISKTPPEGVNIKDMTPLSF